MNLKPYETVKIRRVQAMIDFFTKLPAKHIDLSEFCAIDRKRETLGQARKPACGTIGCLGGWVVMKFGPRAWTLKSANDDWGRFTALYAGRKELGWEESAAELLGIKNLYDFDYDDPASRLFGPNCTGKSDRTEILQRLRRLLKYAKKAQGVQ